MEFFTRSAQHEHAPSHHDWATVAKKCVLFDDLPAAEMKYVQQASKLIQAAKDEVIYEQDDAPNYMYLIHSGRYRASAQGTRYQQMEDFRSSAGRSFMPGSEVVSPDQSFQKRDDGHRKVRVLGPGDNFGACEMLALMGGRQTRVTCTEAGYLWAIPKRIVAQKLHIPPQSKSSPSMLQFLSLVKIFQGIPRDRMVQLCRAAEVVNYNVGEKIFREGEFADALFICKQGTVTTGSDGSSFALTMSPPDAFGEVALFPDDAMRVRSSAIVANDEKTQLIKLPTRAVETLLGYELQDAAVPIVHRKFLSSGTICGRSIAQGLTKDDMDLVLSTVEERTWQPREVIAPLGELNDAMHIIKRGLAVVRAADSSVLGTYQRGDVFGEEALVALTHKQHKRKTSVIVSAHEELVTLSLTAENLQSLKNQDPLYSMMIPQAASAGGGTGIGSWVDSLTALIDKESIHGVDSILVEKVQADGKTLADVLPATKVPKEKKTRGTRKKDGDTKAPGRPSKKASGKDTAEAGSLVTRMARRASQALIRAFEGDVSNEGGFNEATGGSKTKRRSSLLNMLQDGLSSIGGKAKTNPK